MKKLTSYILGVFLILVTTCFFACNKKTGVENEYYTKGLAYIISDDGLSYSVIGRGIATDREIVIPNIYNGLPVIAIEDYAFGNSVFEDKSKYIKSIVIPDSIIQIGNSSFSYCVNLEKVIMSKKLINIGENAFSFCLKLTNIIIPQSVISIGEQAFYGCTALESIHFINPSGWKAGDVSIKKSDLLNKFTASAFLSEIYIEKWTRS